MSALVAAVCLVLATVAAHVAGLSMLTRPLHRIEARDLTSRGRPFFLWVVVSVTLYIVVLHMIEVWIWAAFYLVFVGFADWPTAVHFSLAAYSTVGADQVLSRDWRMLEGVEAITAALMFGVSTAFMFGVINEIYRRWRESAFGETR